MFKLALPVIRSLPFQDVFGCHHHWRPKAGLDFFPPNLTFFLLSPSYSIEGSYVVSKSSTVLDNALT